VNIWLANSALSWVITYAILILFVGITAYETQRLKRIALQMHDNPSMASRYAIVGSLVLYISFINLFLSILRIMGSRR
jgi:FtsH-binding integral membrane protein